MQIDVRPGQVSSYEAVWRLLAHQSQLVRIARLFVRQFEELRIAADRRSSGG